MGHKCAPSLGVHHFWCITVEGGAPMAGQHVCQLQATLTLAESEGVGGEGIKGTSPAHAFYS